MKIALNVKAMDVTIRVTESLHGRHNPSDRIITRLDIENSEGTLYLLNPLNSGFLLRCITFSLYCAGV
jgi:hypothetical protein